MGHPNREGFLLHGPHSLDEALADEKYARACAEIEDKLIVLFTKGGAIFNNGNIVMPYDLDLTKLTSDQRELLYEQRVLKAHASSLKEVLPSIIYPHNGNGDVFILDKDTLPYLGHEEHGGRDKIFIQGVNPSAQTFLFYETELIHPISSLTARVLTEAGLVNPNFQEGRKPAVALLKHLANTRGLGRVDRNQPETSGFRIF